MSLWREVRERLTALRLGDARGACAQARSGGWTARQALDLVEAIERRAINGVAPWAPGAIWWQLARGVPGTSIELVECEEWRRARAAITQRARLQAVDRQRALEADPRLRDLEPRLGAFLDGLTRDQQRELAIAAGPVVHERFRRWQPPAAMPRAVRQALLIVLATQTEASP